MSIVINGASNDILLNGISVTTDAESAASLALKANVASPAFTGTPTINGEVMGGSYGFKNYIINGNFDIWQRGTSQTISSTSGVYLADRWVSFVSGGGSASVNQITSRYSSGGSKNTIRLTYGGTGQTLFLEQRIENGAVLMAGKTYTLSFDTIGVGVTSLNVYSAEVGTDLNITSPISVPVTGTLTRQSVTFTVGSSFTAGDISRYIRFTTSSGNGTTGNYFEIGRVQLEQGSVATPFENRPYGLELALCQRYYEVIQSGASYYKFGTGYVENTTQAYVQVPFKVTKRIIPTILFSGAFATVPTLASTSPSADNQSINGFSVLCTGTGFVAGQVRTLIANGDTSASIIISSEI